MSEHSLPAFAESFYARHGVREACLLLQDTVGCDATLLLAAVWLGCRGSVAGPGEWAAVDAELAPWREAVVVPLRGVRRHLKPRIREPGVEAIREQVRAAELAAEFRALAWLEGRLATAGALGTAAVAANLANLTGGRVPTAALAALWGAAREVGCPPA